MSRVPRLLSLLLLVVVLVILNACSAPAAPTAAPTQPPAAPPKAAAPTEAPKPAAPTEAPKAAAPTTAPAAQPTTAPPPAATSAPAAAAKTGGTTLTLQGAADDYFYKTVPLYGYSVSQPSLIVFNRLVTLDKDGKVTPELAEKWDASPDATKYTFYLRKNAKFHDGKPVTAKDVEFTIKYYLTKATNIAPTNWITEVKGAKDFYEGTSKDLPGVQVKDDYTISIELAAPNSTWVAIAGIELNVLPSHIYANVKPEDIKDNLSPNWFKPELQTGAGPFKFVRAEKDKYFEVARNDDYWGGKPTLDRVVWQNFGNSDTQFIALQKGELDVMQLTADYLQRAKQLPNVNVVQLPRRYIRVYQINYKKPYLSDKRVRQAIVYALDRKALCNDFLLGTCVPYNSFVETDAWLAQGLNQYEYNPDKAKQLLADAQKDGKWNPNQELELAYYYKQPIERDFQAAVQQQLALVGIKSKPAQYESSVAVKNRGEGNFDLMFFGFGFNPEPGTYESIFKCADGYAAYYCNDRVTELFQKGKATTDPAQRHAAYDEIQKIVNEDVPLIPVYRQIATYAINKRVQNFTQGGLAWMLYPWDTGANDSLKWSVTQ